MSIKLNQLRGGQCWMCPDAWDPLQLGSVGSTDYGFNFGVHSHNFVTVEGQGHFILSMETGTRGSSLTQSRVIDEILYLMLHSFCIPDEARVVLFLPLRS